MNSDSGRVKREILIPELILSRARRSRAKVGIGVSDPKLLELLDSDVDRYSKPILVSNRRLDSDLDQIVADDPGRALVEGLISGEFQAAVRGNLGAMECLNHLRSYFGGIQRICFIQISDELKLMAPVGIDEGRNLRDKLELCLGGARLLERFGVDAKIGIVSGGRMEDLSRGFRIRSSIRQSLKLVQMLRERGYEADFHQIDLERAILESNLIILPDGISGNLVFRSLVLVGSFIGWGAPFLMERIFVDTSRNTRWYSNAIKLASALNIS